MLEEALIDAFACRYEPPYWIIEDLLEAGPGPVRTALREAIEAVSSVAIVGMARDARAESKQMFRNGDPELQNRLYLVARDVAIAVQRRRIAEITRRTPKGRAAPYDHPSLAHVEVDRDGLVPLNAFALDGDALCINGYEFLMLPAVPGANANHWLLQQLGRHALVDAVSVRLDPLLHGPTGSLSGHFYRMDVYGRPLDWNRIRNLQSPDHGRWLPGNLSRSSLFTDYAWVPHDDEVDFICEELPPRDEVGERGSRYLHAVYDRRHHRITHLDGAVRVYNADELTSREASHVRNAGKVGTRVKVFRSDHQIDPDVLGDLAQSYFVWNYDVARYFGAPVGAEW
jgi:hypothetical protein